MKGVVKWKRVVRIVETAVKWAIKCHIALSMKEKVGNPITTPESGKTRSWNNPWNGRGLNAVNNCQKMIAVYFLPTGNLFHTVIILKILILKAKKLFLCHANG